MHRGLLLLVLLCVTCLGPAEAQDNAFQRVGDPWNWSFPRDHGSHPQFQTEWWYFTGALQTDDAREFGYELTFFRFALRDRLPAQASPWRARDLILAHFAITDVTRKRFHLSEGLQRGAAGLAGAATDSLHVWLENWKVTQEGDVLQLQAGDEHRARLTLEPRSAPVLHGDQGVSWKSADQSHASYYYSIPRMRTRGTLVVDGQKLEVSGTTWMDHEFFTGDTPIQGVGWDWFSCRLDDGRSLMLYLLRYPDGSRFRSGTLMLADGSSRALAVEGMTLEPLRTWTSPETQVTYPVAWRVVLPQESLDLQVEARLDDQEVHATQTVGFAYWEGLSRYTGTFGTDAVRGEGYVELTGYEEP